jgi:hypothetical protein
MSATDEIKGGIQLINTVVDRITRAGAYANNASLIDVSKVARVEPLVIVDSDCANVEFLPDVMQTLLNLFSGYYLQAAELLGSKIDGVSLARKLAPLNPKQDVSDVWNAMLIYSTESMKHKLPTHKHLSSALENNDKDKGSLSVVNSKIATSVDLSVGGVYTINFSSKDARGESISAKANVSIRLMVNYIASSSVVSILTNKESHDMDLKERFHSWRSGRLEFIKDLILCNDLIDKHKKNLLKDNTGLYKQIVNRELGNKASAVLRGSPSIATASNICVVSTETISAAEAKMYGKIKDFKFRKNLFENTNMMILAVIDKSWERITFYYRGIEDSTTLSVKDLHGTKSKGNDGNVADILKSFIGNKMGTAL